MKDICDYHALMAKERYRALLAEHARWHGKGEAETEEWIERKTRADANISRYKTKRIHELGDELKRLRMGYWGSVGE